MNVNKNFLKKRTPKIMAGVIILHEGWKTGRPCWS